MPAVAAGVVGLASAPAEAAFTAPDAWTRGDGGTTYQAWDVFNDDDASTANMIEDSSPDVAGYTNANGTPEVVENGGNGAFLTSGGNIYSFSGATSFTVTVPEADVPVPAHDVTAIVQTKTLGTELDYSSVKMNGLSPVDSAELSRSALGGQFGGSDVESWFLFNIPYADFGDGAGPDVEDLTLTFNAAGSSMSLDRLAIDTAIKPGGFYNEPNPVPEPASVALVGLGAALLVGGRRRHQQQR